MTYLVDLGIVCLTQGTILDYGLNPSIPPLIQRICIVGATASCKSTLANELDRRLDLPYFQSDTLYWGSNWIHCTDGEFRGRVETTTRGPAWVVVGNYIVVRDLVWPRAETFFWLDDSLPIILWHLWKCVCRRALTGEGLWGMNEKSLRIQFFDRHSFFLWSLQTHGQHMRLYSPLISQPQYSAL